MFRFLLSILFVAIVTGHAPAQEGSLLASPIDAEGVQPLVLENTSFLYQPPSPESESRELRKEDIITVLVDYNSSMLSEGDAQSRRTANINAQLADWIGLDGGDIFAAPQTRGDPTIAGNLNSQFRAQSDIELRDSLTFRIAAKIVDIRPNGNLVIEAHRQIQINEEVWLASLTGVVRRQSIGPDRVVRSDNIADLQIKKSEMGQVRDGYARGWLNRWYGRFKPF